MSQSNQNKGEHYVVDGAIFRCQYGGVPCQIGVLSKPKAVAQNKAMVTENDVTFKSPSAPFATCMQIKTPSGPGTCAYGKGKWKPNTLLANGRLNAVVESSTMICPMFGGEISCVFHGQVQSVSAIDFDDFRNASNIIFPFLLNLKFPASDEKIAKKVSGVYSVSASEHVIRPGETITLRAYGKQKNELSAPNVTNWVIATKKEIDGNNKTKKGLYLDELSTIKKVSSPFNIRFDNPGVYYIEGGSDGILDKYGNLSKEKPLGNGNTFPFFKDCAVKVEVLAHNRITGSRLEGDSIMGGDKEADHKGNDKLFIVKSSDKKVYLDVSTAVALDDEEVLVLNIDGVFTGKKAFKSKIACDSSTYCFTIEPSFFNNKSEKRAEVALVNSKNDKLDSVSYRIRFVDGYVSPSVSHDIFGNNPIPKDSYVRPGTTIFLTASPAETSDKIPDLNNAVWEIVENKVCAEPRPKGSLAMHKLSKEGKVTVTLDLSKCNSVINNKDLGATQYEHTFNVSSNVIKGVVDTPKKWYHGIKYPIHFDLLYDYDVLLDKRNLKFKLDGKEEVLTSETFEVSIDKPGKHCVEYGKKGRFEIEVVDPSVQTWQFSDGKHNRISEVGLDETFYLDVDIPAWSDYQKNVTKAGDGIGKVQFYLWANTDKDAKIIAIEALKNAKMDDDGKAHIALKISKDELARHLGTFNFPPKISIIASLINPPYAAAEILTAKKGYNGHWIYNNAIPLTLVTYPCVEGFFSGKSGNPQKSVMKYGDSVYIMLNTHNCKEMQDKITVELYENNKEGDDDIFGNPFTNIDFDDNGKAKIDLSDLFADETAHGENPNPRLFYFRVKLDGKKIYEYPQTPADVFNMTYRKECDDCDSAIVDIDGESHSISRNDDSCDYESGLKIRSYLWQLKIGKDKEIEKLNQTLAMLAPVVVGEELRKGEKSLGDYRCPRCSEDAEDLKKRLKEMFCDAKNDDLQTIAETYCKYQRLLHMDSCWVKAHFFAQAAVESTHLTEFTERLNYTTKKRLHEVFDSSVFKQKGKKKVEQKLNEIFDETRTSTMEDRKKKIAMLIYGERPKDLGNDTEEDGWTYRGRGLVQITGKAAYEKVGKILLCLGLDKDGIECDLLNNPDLVASDLRLATVASMAFFRYKGCNMYNLCNGNENTYLVTKAVGGFDKAKKQTAFDGKYKTDDGKEKQKEKHTKGVFDVDHCDWKKIKFTGVAPSYHTFSNGRVEKHIPKGCDENTVDHYEFYYHKEDGSCVKICDRTIVREGLFKMNIPTDGKVPSDDEIKRNDIETWKYPKPILKKNQKCGISGDTIYFMPNGDKIVTGTDGVKKYSKIGNEDVELVKIDEGREDGIFEFNKNGVNLYYQIDKTQTVRFYSDPNTFAILIGILAELGANTEYDIKFRGTGNAEIHGTGYPSRTHVNGMSLDFSYSEDADAEIRKAKDIALLKAGIKFNCMTILTGTWKCRKEGRENFSTKPEGDGFHNNHIHLGPFNKKINNPTVIKEN